MNEGLMANHDWINTIKELRAYKPKSVLPGHGPLARDAEIDLLLEIESYFLTEVRKRVEQGMSLNTLLTEMEANLPDWICSIAEVMGNTPLCDFKGGIVGLIDDPEPGWQHLKPSAIPTADTEKLHQKTHALEGFQSYQRNRRRGSGRQ